MTDPSSGVGVLAAVSGPPTALSAEAPERPLVVEELQLDPPHAFAAA